MTKKIIDNGEDSPKCIYIDNCGFPQKIKYLITKRYNYWTDWHIANRRSLAVKQCGSLSNNNHGLRTAKDSSAGL